MLKHVANLGIQLRLFKIVTWVRRTEGMLIEKGVGSWTIKCVTNVRVSMVLKPLQGHKLTL